jgi:fructose-1,6-bisphosphatase I
MPFTKAVTLDQFIAQQERNTPNARGEFSQLLRDITLAAKVIHFEVNRAGVGDILGEAGTENVQGEDQKKLDVLANELMVGALSTGGQVCVIASEENEDVIVTDNLNGGYAVLMDPLDGSSNIDVNVSIGTIFAIYKRTSALGSRGTLQDCLQPGRHQVCAGYVLYGTSTVLVYTTGLGVNAFTLDPTVGEFILSQANIQTPAKAAFYSLNDSEAGQFLPGINAYLDDIRTRNLDKNTRMKARYVGSLVADFHRNMLKGGVFLYPGLQTKPNGKLRLLYEANPMAFIIEQAGGAATDGVNPILDIAPTELHQRVQLVIGTTAEVLRVRELSQAVA